MRARQRTVSDRARSINEGYWAPMNPKAGVGHRMSEIKGVIGRLSAQHRGQRKKNNPGKDHYDDEGAFQIALKKQGIFHQTEGGHDEERGEQKEKA